MTEPRRSRRKSRRRYGEEEEEYDAEMAPITQRPVVYAPRRNKELDQRIYDKREHVKNLREVLLHMNKAANPGPYINYEERLEDAERELDDLLRQREVHQRGGLMASRRPRMARSPPPIRSRSSRLTVSSPEKRRTKRKVPPRDPVTGRFLPRCK